MKILTITNMWPSGNAPYFGIFVKEQVESLNIHYPYLENNIIFIDGRKNKLNYLFSIVKINWHLMLNKYDVIHIHYALSGIFLLFNFLSRKPVVLTLHGSDFNANNKYIKQIVKLIIRRTNHVIYLNDNMRNKLKIHKKEMHHIPCGVDTSQFKVERKPDKSDKSDIINIVFPSSKARIVKNYAFFEQIVNEIRQNHNIPVNIIELDQKTRKEINAIFNSADLVCMTSISEGSPQVIKEAMCCNIPIVSSNVGDVKSLLRDLNNCYVIDSFDVKLFTEAILKIIGKNKNERSTEGRSRIFELGLDEKATSSKLIRLYSKIS